MLGHVPREQMDSLYDRADVVALTSRSEGIPLVLMEAMARGRIVLAPAITGIPELVIPGKTGFLYKPGSLEDFVDRLLFIHSLLRAQTSCRQTSVDIPICVRRCNFWIGFGTAPRRRFGTTSIARRIWSRSEMHSCSGSRYEARASLMRILYCNKYNFPFSGTEVYLFELMELMRSQGMKSRLFSMADPRGEATSYDQHFVPHIDFQGRSPDRGTEGAAGGARDLFDRCAAKTARR